MRRHPPLLPLLVALLVPALVWGAAWQALKRPTVQGHAAQLDARLEGHDPQVIVLGSSLAHRGVDTAVLARELGLRQDAIVMLQLPHAEAAHWYAILKNRVYAHGYTPRLVLVVGALTTMLNHDTLAYEANVERLVEQLGDDEPVIATKVFGFDDPAAFRERFVREHAGTWRQVLLDAVRDRMVTWLFAPHRRLDEGQALVERVNDEVFGNAQMDYALHRDAPTGLASEVGALTPVRNDAFDLRRDALVGDLAALAHDHGAELAFVRMPFPPSNATMDVVPPDIADAALAWMDEVGAGYLDLRSLDLGDADFEDMRHLSRRGAVTFTTAMARSLQAMGALDGDGGLAVVQGLRQVPTPGRPSRASLPIVHRRAGCRWEGPAGALAAFTPEVVAALPPDAGVPFVVRAGDRGLDPGVGGGDAAACTGTWAIVDGVLEVAAPDAGVPIEVVPADDVVVPEKGGPMVWLLPGERVHFEVDAGWSLPPRTFRVTVRGTSPGADARAEVTVAGQVLPVVAREGHLLGSAWLTPPDGPWTVDVAVPADAPPLLVHHLAVGTPPVTTSLLGVEETLHGASVRLVGGRLDDTRGDVTYDAPPVQAPLAPKLKPGPRTLAIAPLPGLADLADAATQGEARPSTCSPIVVLEDGVPLPGAHATCADVWTEGRGRWCHAGANVYLTATDGTPPQSNGRRYTVALDPRRTCATWTQAGAATLRGSWWLYPHDTVHIQAPQGRLRAFRDGANQLVLEAVPLVASPSAPLSVQLTVDGAVVLDTTWALPAGTARSRLLRVPIEPAVPPSARDVTLTLSHPDDATFVLLTLAALEEHHGDADAVAASAVVVPRTVRRLPVQAAGRTGQAPPLPPLKVVGPFEYGAFEAQLFPLWPVSNTALDKLGLGAWSPLRVVADGQDLVPLASQKAFKAGCGGCFLHTGKAVLFRAAAGAEASLEARLDEAFPLQVSGEADVWWVYPGQQGWWDVALDAAQGPRHVEIAVVGVAADRERAGEALSLSVGDAPVTLRSDVGAGVFTARHDLPPGEGTVRVTLANGSDRGFALVRRLTVVDDRGAALVLGADDASP
ncbi:MAG: hypothetical protein H6733_12585 [Alphaproteobacteria bacterium]|nr:hypothetical protein [Alphaproteobacteria bacterium]